MNDSTLQSARTARFLDFLHEITRHYGIVLIFDEVITFRLGLAGAPTSWRCSIRLVPVRG